MLGPGLSLLHEWSYMSLNHDPIYGYYAYSHFTDEKTEARYNSNMYSMYLLGFYNS